MLKIRYILIIILNKSRKRELLKNIKEFLNLIS
jgi:hypothetical protein